MPGIFPFSVSDKDADKAALSRLQHRDQLYAKISECKYSEDHLKKVSVAGKEFCCDLIWPG